MKTRLLCVLAALGVVLCGQSVRADAPAHTAAIFVKNHADTVPDEKVAALEDLIGSHLADNGFRVIARDDVLNAVSGFADAGANKGDPNLPGATLDKVMSNNTSALRLAQNLNADCILVASITTYGDDEIEYDEPDTGVHTKIYEYKLTVSYKLLDTAAGGSLTGGVIESSKKDRAQPGLTIKRDMLNNLMIDAAQKLADAISDKAATGRIAPAPTGQVQPVSFTAVCGMGDLSVPEVTQSPQGEYTVTPNRYKVEAMNVNVALDGVTLGTTPGPFQALPGLHKIRLSRDGFKDWEQTINIRNGLVLNVDLQMTDAGYERWRNTASFLEGLKEDSKLTDARVQEMQGYAKMLEQSGFRIDIRKNINRDEKSDTKVVDITGDNSSTQPSTQTSH
jgi:hypothetical protein